MSAEAMAHVEELVDAYRASLLQAFGLTGRMECDGPDATENVPPAVSAGLGGIPAGVRASSPDGLPPAGAPDPSHMCPPRGCRGVCGEGPAADSAIRSAPAAGRQLPVTAVESGFDIGGVFCAEMFPQFSKYQQ